MSSNCSFEQHIIELRKRCTGLCGWILRIFSSRESTVMMTLFKSVVLSRHDYGSPTKIHQIILIERIQTAFTKHIKGFSSFSYQERLCNLKMFVEERGRTLQEHMSGHLIWFGEVSKFSHYYFLFYVGSSGLLICY